MLAMISTQCKELVPILAAHIYTVCPTAIPALPKVTKNESENELMESLGMTKGKDGQYETFDRFLARTEVRRVPPSRVIRWPKLSCELTHIFIS